eukprot:TRINITY_DN2685_c0_g1_i1.p2 TRINITY_DN2685_c0_g1~~TRINITY_DN2685_c0_g1_i1.p2  ORF type:complete len:328 (+),score=109.22 TRINITY_DN2685_c0_g1_i1:65-985(+)
MAKAGGDEVAAAAPAAEAAEKVTMVHVSDTHNLFCEEVVDALPKADILFHTGDFTNHGSPEEYKAFNEALQYARKTRFDHIVVVYGNHDVDHVFSQKDAEKMDWTTPEEHIANWHRSGLAARLPAATEVPTLQEVTVKGLRVFGVPWFPCHASSAARYEEADGLLPWAPPGSTGCIDTVPDGVDVLLTHGPPFDVLDEADYERGMHWGAVPGLRRILAERRPKLHLFGHIHESNGTRQVGETLCVNGANKNWPRDQAPEGHRLAFDARLLTAVREGPERPWSIEVTDKFSLQDASIQGRRRRDAGA